MTEQQELHRQAIEHLGRLKEIIDALKALGPCPHDGWNALANIQGRPCALSRR